MTARPLPTVQEQELSSLPQDQEAAISVALYLRQYHGWSRWMLSPDGVYARLGRYRGKWCLEPHRRLFRLLTRKRLPLDQAFPPDLRIRFLPSLKWRSSVSSLGVGVIALLLGGLAHSSDVLDTSELDGWIEDSLPSKPASSFPVGQWVRITTYVHNTDRSIWVEDSSKTSWKLSAVALTSPTDIEVDTQSIVAAWKNIKE